MKTGLEVVPENYLVNFPNLVSDDLWGLRFPVTNAFGETNVCVRQGPLPECNGRIDLAFVTSETIHLIELKAKVINVQTLNQFRRYCEPIQARYPAHKILGYLVGKLCRAKPRLKELIGDDPIEVLRLGIELPHWNQIVRCGGCGAGILCDSLICRYCGSRL